jgi:hypothetical protein
MGNLASTTFITAVATVALHLFGLLPVPLTGSASAFGGLVVLAALGLAIGSRRPGIRTLAALVAGVPVGLAGGVALTALVHRAFSQTAWRIPESELAFELLLTSLGGVAAVAVGFALVSGVPAWRNRRDPRPPASGGVILVLVALLAVPGLALGSARLAAVMEAVIPEQATYVQVTIQTDAMRIMPTRLAYGPTYWTFVSSLDRDVELVLSPIDGELDLEAIGQGRGHFIQGFATGAHGEAERSRLDLEPGRYALFAIELSDPTLDDGTQPQMGLIPGLITEFTVTARPTP